MNITDAIKSGRRFRKFGSLCYFTNRQENIYSFSLGTLMADDWELEPLPVEAPKMVKKYLWVYRLKGSKMDNVTYAMYTEEQFKECFKEYYQTDSFEKIPGTEMLRPE